MKVGKGRKALAWLCAGLIAAPTGLAAARPLAAGEELPADVLPGPLSLSVRLAADHDRAQPLLAIGGPDHGGLLFWLWDADGRARIGFEDAGQGVSFSPPFSAAGDRAHTLEIAWGALWPATALPSAGLSADLRDLLWVAVDGQPLLSRKQGFGLRASHVVFGANLIGSSLCRPFFKGTLATVERSDSGRPESASAHLMVLMPGRDLLPGGYPGPLHLRLSLPSGVAGRSEPLLIGGKAGAAGIFYVRYDDERHVRLGFDSWGLRGPLSAPIAFQPGADYDLRLSTGLLFPPAIHAPQAGDSPRALLPAVLWVEWNGHPVLATVVPCPAVLPAQIALGANLIGWGLTEPIFRGLFSRVERLDPAAIAEEVEREVFPRVPAPGPAWQGYPGPVRLRIIFPESWRPGTGDPLVVAGSTGAADTIFVHYDDDGRVRFGMDRWGWAALTSAPIAVAPGSEHEVTIGMGSLLPPEGAPLYAQHPELAARRQDVRIDFDGRTILTGVRPPNRVRPEQIAYGINLAGGSTSGPAFTGRIVRMEGLSWEAWEGVRR